jgi:hypothetical protein
MQRAPEPRSPGALEPSSAAREHGVPSTRYKVQATNPSLPDMERDLPPLGHICVYLRICVYSLNS